MTPADPWPHSRPATHPDGGWGALRPPLPAPPLDAATAQCDEDSVPVTLRSLVLPGGSRAAAAVPRAGLLSLLARALGARPADLVVDDGPCAHCGRLHAAAATSPAGAERYFATVRHADRVLYAVCPFPVGLALAVRGTEPARPARKSARLAAQQGAVARGRCVRPRDGSVEYVVRYVEAQAVPDCVVAVVWEVPHAPGT
ncbi:hypothetical protein [Streptomyces sp. NPDC049813]|uniref:hypothetical protein n=1 Tax=Streptomyces sp. NPDC049813 TaxID=3365597 RepID=UPI00378E921A